MARLVLVASLGGFLFGYDTGIVAGAQLFFADDFPELAESELKKDLVVSLAQLGALVGALAAGPLSDKYGRKPIILAADVLFTAGSVLMYAAPSVAALMAGRVVVGLGVGLASLIVPVYLAEVSPTEVRGAVVAVDVMVITAGQFLSSLVSLALGRRWRLMLGAGAIPAALQLVGMLFMPESQRWLAKVGRNEEARGAMAQIYRPGHRDGQVDQLLQEIAGMQAELATPERERLRQLFGKYSRCLLVGCGLQFFQQFVGINTVMYYGPSILQATGISVDGVDPATLAIRLNIPLAAMNAIGSTVAVFVLDKAGRRWIMLRGLPGIFASCLVVSLAMYLSLFGGDPDGSGPQTTEQQVGNYLAVAGLVLYLAAFSVSMSSSVWSVNTEIYPIHLVGTATSLATATNWGANFLVSTFFLSIMRTDTGCVLAFLLLGAFAIAAWLFVYRLLPETGGREISENVENVLRGGAHR